MEVLLTDLCSASPYIRLLNKIRARRQSIHWQARIQKSHPKRMKTELKSLTGMETELNSVSMYSITRRKYKKILRQFNKLDTRENHMIGIFGKCLMPSNTREPCQIETNMLASMAMDNRIKRVNDLRTRILLEIIDKESRGWFIVFTTLTVANEYYKEVFNKDNRIFEKYILSLTYAVKKQAKLNGKCDKKDTASYHTYFAVVEEGGQTGRLHIHVLHCLRYLVTNSCDPNYGRKLPKYRIIAAMRQYWTRGFSTPIAVRLAGTDNYSRLGWRWPVKKTKDGSAWEALETSTPQRMAGYMAKYITKSNEERSFRWRTRISQGYGTTIIKRSLRQISTKILEKNLINVTIWKHLEVMDIAIPLSLTRKLSVREWLKRKNENSKGSKISTIQKSLMKVQAQPSIVEQLRILTQKKQRYNCKSTSSTKTKSLKRQDIFRIREAFTQELINCNYHLVVQKGGGVTRECR